MEKIDWKKWEEEFKVRIDRGQEKKLIMTNWRTVPAIKVDVLQEDGSKVNKQWRTMSFKTIRQLKPIIQKADAAGKNKIAVGLLLTGEGIDSNLAVRELLPSYREVIRG